MPRVCRDGGGLEWESRYEAVVAAGSMTPGGPIDWVFDGLNEKGLGANLLYLAEADFGQEPSPPKSRARLGHSVDRARG